MKPRYEDMHPVLQARYDVFKALAEQQSKVPFALVCVLRMPPEQVALHAQGRKPLAEVNRLRKLAGMPYMITAAENKYKVTWTLNSKHFPDANGKSRAFDIVVLKNGRTETWDLKWDGDKDAVADYEELAKMMELAGLVAGGFAFGDWPHGQLPQDVA